MDYQTVAGGVGELSWSRRAAEQWMKTHDTSDKNKSERLEQLTKIFERSTRRQNLFDKRCEEAAATEAQAQAEQEQRELTGTRGGRGGQQNL
jgi:hypothetical protein